MLPVYCHYSAWIRAKSLLSVNVELCSIMFKWREALNSRGNPMGIWMLPTGTQAFLAPQLKVSLTLDIRRSEANRQCSLHDPPPATPITHWHSAHYFWGAQKQLHRSHCQNTPESVIKQEFCQWAFRWMIFTILIRELRADRRWQTIPEKHYSHAWLGLCVDYYQPQGMEIHPISSNSSSALGVLWYCHCLLPYTQTWQ